MSLLPQKPSKYFLLFPSTFWAYLLFCYNSKIIFYLHIFICNISVLTNRNFLKFSSGFVVFPTSFCFCLLIFCRFLPEKGRCCPFGATKHPRRASQFGVWIPTSSLFYFFIVSSPRESLGLAFLSYFNFLQLIN
jgi:hypothetical protein